MFYEFHNTTFYASLYYPLFMLRRLGFALSQLLLNNHVFIQVVVNLGLALWVLGYVWHVKPFNEAANQRLNFFMEFGVVCVFLLTAILSIEPAETLTNLLSYLIVGTCLTLMAVNILFVIATSVCALITKCREKRRKGHCVIDSPMYNRDQPSIFYRSAENNSTEEKQVTIIT